MPRVSAERMFRSHFPHATIEKQRYLKGGFYYLVREELGDIAWSGSGDTKARAWSNACERLGITSLKEQSSDQDQAGAGARIIAARIESAGLVVERYHGDLTTYGNGDQARTITVRVPARLIDEQLKIESDPIAIMRDKGLL
ncbi:MAG TPA: hypothetical protein VFO62_10645 [Candidatus Binatia bacterium]|nr:hypothetical protein [Candidatus Binatia bacterium]